MASGPLIRASGLVTQPNRLAVPEGALIEASNVVINRDNVIEPRRGYKLYGEQFGTSSDRAKQLFVYRQRILRHYNNFIQYDTNVENQNGESIFETFSGNYTETQDNLKIKSTESNGNFYFTTADGVKKISASSASDFTTDANFIEQAGGIKAVDFVLDKYGDLGSTSGFMAQDSVVAYRIVWAKEDRNKNLIPGAPSQREEIYVSLLNLMLQDFMRLLGALDDIDQSTSLITDGNYASTLGLTAQDTAASLRTNLISLATKLDNDIVYTEGSVNTATGQRNTTTTATIVFNSSVANMISPGDSIKFSGWTSGSLTEFNSRTFTVNTVSTTTITATILTGGNFSGTDGAPVIDTGASAISNNYTIITQPSAPSTLPTNDQLLAIQQYMSEIISRLQSELSDVIPTLLQTEFITPLESTTTSNIKLTITIPEGITEDYFYQIYRSLVNTATGTTVLTDLSASDEMALVYEAYPTQEEIDSGQLVVIDSTPDTFRGANLYTNAISGEGILQSNDLPPLAKDINIFKNVMFYANTKTRYRLSLNLLGVSNMLLDYGTGLNTKTFTSGDIDTGTDVITITSHGFSNEQAVELYNPTPTDLPGGLVQSKTYYISYLTNNTFRLTNTRGGAIVDITSGGTGTHSIRNQLPKINISNSSVSNTYTFVTGLQQVTDITCVAGSLLAATGTADYFTLNSAENNNQYYFWYNVSGGTMTDPLLSNKIGVQILVLSTDTASQIAQKTKNVINKYINDFSVAENTLPTIRVTNIDYGYTDSPEEQVSDAGFIISVYQSGRGEKASQQTSLLTCSADTAGNLASDYFTLSTAFDKDRYYVWYKVSGVGTDPAVSGYISVVVNISDNDTASTVAAATKAALDALGNKFITTQDNGQLTIKNYDFGPSASINITNIPTFTVSVMESGALEVFLSPVISVGQAVDATARSLVRLMNKNKSELVYAYYLSTGDDTPGKLFLEARDLSMEQYAVVGNNSSTGISFNPDISPTKNIVTNSAATYTVITTATAHNLINGDSVSIVGSNSFPSIDGKYPITYITSTTFSIPVTVLTAGNSGSFIKTTSSVTSSNEEKINRIYYSKYQQPEAVPLLNYLDIGSGDKEILRIFPLRDSLFVFKKDGVYRISGETEPFVVSLFDSSCILAAPDSVAVSNNNIYLWATQGISICTESGINIISRPIEDDVNRLASTNFPNFSYLTWGLGYESDNTYLVWTVQSAEDTEATICYRFNNVTNTWTTFDKNNTCGLINIVDDLMYLGAGDTNYIEQERKGFSRYDYTDRELTFNLLSGNYINDTIKLLSVSGIEVGDVIVQEQYLTAFQFNGLLQKMDTDGGIAVVDITSITTGLSPLVTTNIGHNLAIGDKVKIYNTDSTPILDGIYEVQTVPSSTSFTVNVNSAIIIAGTTGNARLYYEQTVNAINGSDLRTQLLALTAKMDTDPGISDTDYTATIQTQSGTITDISIANPTVITTSAPHNLSTGRYISIISSDSDPLVDGTYEVTVISPTTFSIPVNVSLTQGTTGSFTTADTDFRDLQNCFNLIVSKLNADTNVNFGNYVQSSGTTIQEAVITDINTNAKQLTVNLTLPFVTGVLTIFKSYDTTFTYAPNVFGDPVMFKHMREATIMFDNKAFTNATLSFATDLLPEFQDVNFEGSGNGIFGHIVNFGDNFFGGGSHAAPFRTYIPRNCQRCRYIVIKFSHKVAREQYSVYGISLTGDVYSTRAYR